MTAPVRRRDRFRNRAELLDYLLEVTSATSETLELDKLLGSVARSITRAIPAQLFAILLYSERRQGLRIRYSIGHRQELIDRWATASPGAPRRRGSRCWCATFGRNQAT